jgi:hypothetical protein
VLGALWVGSGRAAATGGICRVLTCRSTTNDILFNVVHVKHFFQQFCQINKNYQINLKNLENQHKLSYGILLLIETSFDVKTQFEGHVQI